MLITTHAITGFTIGSISGNPYLASPLCFASHYIFDALPHFEVSTFRKPNEKGLLPKNFWEVFFVLIDIFVALIFLFFFRHLWSPASLAGVVFSVLPDFLDNVFLWSSYLHKLPIFQELFALHKEFHHTARGKKIFLGILTQVIIICICFAILFL